MRPSTLEPPDSGRKCYREPGEARDERPCLLIREFWASPEECSAYLSAVRNHPRKPDEGPGSYIARIGAIVQRGPLGPPVKRMPSPWSPDRARPIPKPEAPYEERLDAIFSSERQSGEDDE